MSVVQVLIEPGQTPSGFGLALVRELSGSGASWYMRPLSPCCGAYMDPSEEYKCEGACTLLYEKFAEDCAGTIGNFVPIGDDTTEQDTTLARWIARIMEFPNSEGTHNVKVGITWT